MAAGYVAAGVGRGATRSIQEWRWFPAFAGTGQSARIRDIGRLLTLMRPDGSVPPGWPTRIEAALETGYDPPLPAGAFDVLAPLPIAARLGARAAAGSFPLVVIGQGFAYESPFHQHMLAEYLASHGYRVVTAPLTGATAYASAVDPPVFAAAVDDLRFLPARRLIDSLLAPRPGFTFDGMRAPYLHVTRTRAENIARGLPEDLSALEEGGGPSRTLLRIPRMRHADFFTDAAIENVIFGFAGPVAGDPPRAYAELLEFLRQTADRALKGKGPEPQPPAGSTVESWPR